MLFFLDLVLQVNGAVTSGTRLCVATCALTSEERDKLASGGNDEDIRGLDNEDRYLKTFSQIIHRSWNLNR